MNEELIKVSSLSISAKTREGEREIVSGVNFSLNRGKVLAIVGESGSGKSVTCFSIVGLLHKNLRITKGEITFNIDGKSIGLTNLPEKQYRQLRGGRISMIFQEPMSALNPVERCGKQVAEVLKLHTGLSGKEIRKEVMEIFGRVKLPNPERIYRAYPHELSGGQKQRVVIAIAIACKPDLVIADEPTTALDVTVQKEILNLLAEIQRQSGMSIIFITHDLAVVSEFADDVLVMYQGGVQEFGPRDEVFGNPKSPYTKGLLACRPKIGKKLKRLPVIFDFMSGKKTEEVIIRPEEIRQNEIDIEKREKLLEIKNLSKYFKIRSYDGKKNVFEAVDNVSLDIYKGETLGLVGESGCGKSTFSRAVLMLDTPTEGEIFYKGQDITRMSQRQITALRKDMQIIFQDPFASLNPVLSIGEALMEPMVVHNILGSHKERKMKIVETLEKVGLDKSALKRYPHQFSGGQRQRIGIARALVVNPSFIICDESVSALDISVQAQVLNVLSDLKEYFGFTYLFISHDLSVVQYMSDHIAVMQCGKIVEYGRTDEIYSSPKSVYTKNLMDAVPKLG